MFQGPVNWKDRYVTLARNEQNTASIAKPDTSAFVVVVWQDLRDSLEGYDIYAQMIETVNGLAVWSPIDGVPVCTVSGNQVNPRAAYDTLGGVIITWEDYRNGVAEIYAHRIDLATGRLDPNWSSNPDGKPVCAGTWHPALRPKIAGDPDGAYITWTDYRNEKPPTYVERDVYVQYLKSIDGNPATGWNVNDYAGAAVVVWEDRSDNATSQSDIYAQRVLAGGTNMWPTPGGGGLAICTDPTNQVNPQLVSFISKAGTYLYPTYAYIAWEDERNYVSTQRWDVYSSLVNVDAGQVITSSPWAQNGRVVCNALNDQRQVVVDGHSMTSQGTGVAITAWKDERNGIANSDIYFQEVEIPGGTELWSANGDPATRAIYNQELPRLSDQVLVWDDYRRGDGNIHAQKLGEECDGPTSMSWRDMFAKWTFNYPAENHRAAVDAIGNTFIVWQEDRDTTVFGPEIYAFKLDRDGVPQWRNDGVLLSDPSVSASEPDVCIDRAGGAVVVWKEGAGNSIVVKQVRNDGSIVSWPIGRESGTQPRIVDSNVDEAVVVWMTNPEIHGKKLTPTTSSWDNTSSGLGTVRDPVMCKDGKGGAFLIVNNTIKIITVWFNPPVGAAFTSKDLGYAPNNGGYDICYDLINNNVSYYDALTTWSENNGTQNVVKFQRIKAKSNGQLDYGSTQPSNLTPIQYYANSNSYSPKIAPDSLGIDGSSVGGALVAWYSVFQDNSYRVSAQRVYYNDQSGSDEVFFKNASNNPQPLYLSNGNWVAMKPDIAKIGAYPFTINPPDPKNDNVPRYGLVVWQDDRDAGCMGTTALLAQFVDFKASRASAMQWGSNGKVVSLNGFDYQGDAVLLENIEASGSVVWMDNRNMTSSIIGNRIMCLEGALEKSGTAHRARSALPGTVRLLPNYPNPFSAGTTIPFSLAGDAHVTLSVYSPLGREVACLVDENLETGSYSVHFSGGNLSPGVYYCRLTAGRETRTRMLLLIGK